MPITIESLQNLLEEGRHNLTTEDKAIIYKLINISKIRSNWDINLNNQTAERKS